MKDNNRTYVAHFRESDQEIQTVKSHLEETSELAGLFADKIGMKKWGELIGVLHDLGKNTELFNRYIRSATGMSKKGEFDYINVKEYYHKIDHATAGGQYLYQLERLSAYNRAVLALIIKSHHGGLIDCLAFSGEDNLQKKMSVPDEDTRLIEALNCCEPEIMEVVESISEELLANSMKANIGLMKNQSPEVKKYMRGMIIRFLFSCLIDADRTNTADFEMPENSRLRQFGKYVSWDILIDRLENHLNALEVRNHIDEIRRAISDQCERAHIGSHGIYRLTVPTGGGKTYSSLRFALKHAKKHGMDRIIYVIPLTTIIDQNADDIRNILEKGEPLGSVVLEHHSNLTPEEETEKTKLISENWDAPIVFTTMVQLLDTLFSGGTNSVRRMHQLANSVIIFDEIQTLNVKMVHIFNGAIKFLTQISHSTVVLCTATQPLLDKIDPKHALSIPDDNNIIKNPDALHKELSRVDVKDLTKEEGWADEDICNLMLGEINQNKSTLVIVNTKASALKLIKLTEGLSNPRYHLSTSMCPEHRMHVIQEMKLNLEKHRGEQGAPIICISTQLIEAGVNIDFQTVIRYIAGLDSIVQAAGRCNRNGTMQRNGTLYIVNPRDESLSKLIDISGGSEITEKVLRQFKKTPETFEGDLLSPKALEGYYERYFYSRNSEMAYSVEHEGVRTTLFELLSDNPKAMAAAEYKKNGMPQLPYAFKTAGDKFRAIDTSTQGIIVQYGDAGKKLIADLCACGYMPKFYALLKKAQRYSVNLFSYQLRELEEKKAIHEVQAGVGVYYLDEAYYNSTYGVLKESKGNQESIIL